MAKNTRGSSAINSKQAAREFAGKYMNEHGITERGLPPQYEARALAYAKVEKEKYRKIRLAEDGVYEGAPGDEIDAIQWRNYAGPRSCVREIVRVVA